MKYIPQAYVLVSMLLLCLSNVGCALLNQDRDTVYVRKSGDRHFDLRPEMLTREIFEKRAESDWQYAVMSENSYHGGSLFPTGFDQSVRLQSCKDMSGQRRIEIAERANPRSELAEFSRAGGSPLLSDGNWNEWAHSSSFLKMSTWCKSVEEAVAFKIYERQADGRHEIAISFRGTVFGYWENWKANLRWFIQWPRSRQDGNVVVQHEIADDLALFLIQRYPQEVRQNTLDLYVTGHSLGGAFAQQLAYAFPPISYSLEQYPGLRIKKVVVFDPSPVNGWDWVEKGTRERNAGGLSISRIYQHGEVLAYVRLMLSYVYKPTDGDCIDGLCTTPKIEEVRYNALYQPGNDGISKEIYRNVLRDPVDGHSMRSLAAGLSVAAKHTPLNMP